VPLNGTAGPRPSATADLGADLAERAAAVTLVPTGFAVRPLPGTGPVAVPSLATGDDVPGEAAVGASGEAPSASPSPALPGGWLSRDDDRWLLRWSPTPAETRSAVKDEEWVRMGSLAALAGFPMSVAQDPRFVTPDGACSVYLAPFVSGTAGARNSVAVVGDSLVAQLYASEDGTTTGTGRLMRRLITAGARAEIAGQGGRRWTIKPNVGSSLETAEASMLDEIRGLREARSMVVALGTNDVGWVALAANQEQYELRLAWVFLHLTAVLDELRDHGHCTVLATMATRNKSYDGADPARFAFAAARVNDYLRQRAGADPNDRLRLWDWAAHADGHGTTDPQPWFGSDTIHLRRAGLAPYADELASAAALC
jgi:lysophospholipase L1-like esterase